MTDTRKLLIVHLDDHNLFLQGVEMCLKKEFPNAVFQRFSTNDAALQFIRECYGANIRIDLIITDYNHPGPNGFVFGQEVRKLQGEMRVKTPILLFTMCNNSSLLTATANEDVFDGYLLKAASAEELLGFVKEVL